jgi:hypothetical protein
LIDRSAAPLRVLVRIPGLTPGRYRITAFDTVRGEPTAVVDGAVTSGSRALTFETPAFQSDLALAIRRDPI